MQITKRRFFLAARGVQLDNGVTPPWLVRMSSKSLFGPSIATHIILSKLDVDIRLQIFCLMLFWTKNALSHVAVLTYWHLAISARFRRLEYFTLKYGDQKLSKSKSDENFFRRSPLCRKCAIGRGASDEIQRDASRWTSEHILYSDIVLWAEGCAGSPLFALNMTSKMWRSEAGEQLEHYGEGRSRRRGALCRLWSTMRSSGGWRLHRGASCHLSSKPWHASLDTCLHSVTHAHDLEGIG